MKTNCTITIRIGDQEITLDPGANISANDIIPLAKSISADKLRALYGQLKSSMPLDAVLTSHQQEFIDTGKALYTDIVDKALTNTFPTLLDAIRKENDPNKLKALTAYASSLDGTEILSHGNFFIDPKNTYKASPYTAADIRAMVFKKDGDKVKLFDELVKLPGMETLKMSISYATTWNGAPMKRVGGAYITPDNIVQIVVPFKKGGYHVQDDYSQDLDTAIVNRNNLGSKAKNEIQDVAIHELLHAVYTELYNNDNDFKSKINSIHKGFIDKVGADSALGKQYKNVNEFLASIFSDNRLQDNLSKVPSILNQDFSSLNSVVSLVQSKLKTPTLLSDYITLVGSKLDTLGTSDALEINPMELTNNLDNTFFDEPDALAGAEEQEANSPRGQYDSKQFNHRSAFYASQRFDKRWKQGSFVRDSHYKGTIIDPSKVQIDVLSKDDVILLPWLRYVKATKTTKGYYQEVGIVVDKKGNPITIKGKNRIAPIVRIDGVIQPTAEGNKIEERTQAFPVMYSNVNKKHVVVAKTDLNAKDEFFDANAKFPKYNTISFPYELIKGIRKLDYGYFNHNDNFAEQLKDAEKNLAQANALKGTTDKEEDKKFDDIKFYTTRVEQLQKNIDNAKSITEDIVKTHHDYGFSHTDADGNIVMNVTEEAYRKSSYTLKNIAKRKFKTDQDAVFILDRSQYKTKDGKDTSFLYPNPRLFDIFWDYKLDEEGKRKPGELGKNFARLAESYSEAISKGDVIRVNQLNTYKDDKGDEHKVKQNQWLTVYKKVANGVMVTTEKGVGFIVPYNMINAYAKNRDTDDYRIMLADFMLQLQAFNQDFFTTRDGKRHFSNDITAKKATFDKEYYTKQYPEADLKIAIEKFDKRLAYAKDKIKPMESFVRIDKWFTNEVGKLIRYPVNGFVMAKSDNNLVVLTETKGAVTIETIPFDSKFDGKTKQGSEITYIVESQAKVRKAYNELQDENAQYIENKKTANFKFDKSKWSLENDPKLNPHGVNDAYDFYSNTKGIDGTMLEKLKKSEGSIIAIKLDKAGMTSEEKEKYAKADYYYRKVVRVQDDGTIVVAAYNATETKMPNGFVLPAGRVYARYIDPADIVKIGYKLGVVGKYDKDGKLVANSDEGTYRSEYNQDLIERRKYLWERSKVDRDFDKFDFVYDASAVKKLNIAPIQKDRDYYRAVPLTNIIKDPLTKDQKDENVAKGRDKNFDDRKTEYLDKNFNIVPREKAAQVIAVYLKGTDKLKYVKRGILVNTSVIYSSIATTKVNDKTVFKQDFLDGLYPGDWITTKNANGEYWDALIERIEGDNIYTLNTDLTTSWVNPSRMYAARLSKRNDRWSNFTRPKSLIEKLKKTTQTSDAVESNKDPKPTTSGKRTPKKNLEEDEPPFSLEAAYKSPKSSRRALLEIGNRLKALNPDIKLSYVDQEKIDNLAKLTGHDYSNARAFVLKGTVYINMDRASVSDVIHEYAHLFLNTLKYENNPLYKAIIQTTNNHSLYHTIAADYSHLNTEDLNEEVFVTVLGEYIYGDLKPSDKQNMDDNQEHLLDFANYAKQTMNRAFNTYGKNIYDINPANLLSMSFEDVINLVGDQLMNNKITDVYQSYPLTTASDITALKDALYKQGLIINQC